MKRNTIIVTLAVALASLAALAAPTQATSRVSVTRTPLNFHIFNPCTDELVTLSGTQLVVVDTTPDDGHYILHSVDTALQGVGETTGEHYVFVAGSTIAREGSVDDVGAFTETQRFYSRLITAGGGNDLDFEIFLHTTINANGDVTAFFDRVIAGACV